MNIQLTNWFKAAAMITALTTTGCTTISTENTQMRPDATQPPIIIAHRGASGYLPEHTLEAAILAFSQGADFIEQDLVLSKDGELIVLHDIHLERTTDVEQKFPLRARDDGRFYAIDFTLAELKTLIVHERHTAAGQAVFKDRYTGNAPFRLATFEEQIVLINQLNQLHDKNVGLYPEIKAPAWHINEGQDISQVTLAMLRKHQLDSANAAVYLQCFDFNELKRIKKELNANVKLVQLLAENSWNESTNDYNYLRSSAGLTEIAEIAAGVGPWLGHLVDPANGQITPLVSNAKQLGLKVHPYTFRADQLPPGLSAQQTSTLLFEVLAVEGIFSDHTDVSKKLLSELKLNTTQ